MFLFQSDKILVAMATYIFHRLIMGKVNIDTFFCLNGDIGIYVDRHVYGVVLYVSCVFFSKSLNLIGYQGDKKGKF